MMIMSGAVFPPRIELYQAKMVCWFEKYPNVYALQYQCDDRFRHEEVVEMDRKELAKYRRKVDRYERQMANSSWTDSDGWQHSGGNQPIWTVDEDAETEYDPDDKWDHLYHLMVNSKFAADWWMNEFILHAQDVRHKVTTLDSKLDRDAPIAKGATEHPAGVLQSGINSHAVAQQPKGGGKAAGNERKRPASDAFADRWAREAKALGKGQPADQAGRDRATATAGPRTHSNRKCGGHEICRGFINGVCGDVDANGACGPFTCKAFANLIHACTTCGGTGHDASACSHKAPGAGKKKRR
jgi:hypothetical protein